ncbi:MAG: hypothetical protein H0T85_11400 [Geodermatophilaceae bacterium]|nr:hypothetical protein [Geodermatophilaceae bacterium]
MADAEVGEVLLPSRPLLVPPVAVLSELSCPDGLLVKSAVDEPVPRLTVSVPSA